MEAVQNKADALVDRINSLNKVFEQADNVCSSEVIEFIEEKTQEVKLYSSIEPDISTTEVLKLNFLVDDFTFTRDTLKETVENGRKIIQTVTLELLDSDDDKRSALISAFAELVSSVNQSVKLLSQSYKDIASVLESVEKIRKSKLSSPDKSDKPESGNTYINISTQESTTDIIARLAQKKADG